MVALTGLAVVLLQRIFKNNNAILWLDVRLLLGCMLAMGLRLFILADSPVANNIPVFSIYPELCWFLRDPLFDWGGISISIMKILQGIWIIGAIFFAIYRIREYRMTQRRIRSNRRLKNREFDRAAERINNELGKKAKFRLVTSKEFATPCVFGVFRPYIGIPEMEFEEKDIYLVMKHEMLHYYRGDMIIKILCEALRAVYWWNPFVYILVALVDKMQEINVDFRIVRDLPKAEQLEYADCLIRVVRSNEKRNRANRWAIGFRKESPSEIKKRIRLIMENQDISGKKTAASFVLSAVIMCMIVIGPNILTFEPYAIHEEHAVGSVGITRGGICYLDNKDGTYDIYIDGQYFKTTKTLFDEHIPIYDNLEEAKGND